MYVSSCFLEYLIPFHPHVCDCHTEAHSQSLCWFTLYTVQTWNGNSHYHVYAHPRGLAHWTSNTTIVDKHVSKQHIRWHTNHSTHVTRWQHSHRNTNRNWPAQHMSACRWAFRLRSVQYSGHILLVTYSFWLPERSTFPFVFLSCLRVWRLAPLVQTHSGRNQKSLKSTLEEKRHRNCHLLLFMSKAPTFCLLVRWSSCLLPYQSPAQTCSLTHTCMSNSTRAPPSLIIRSDVPLLSQTTTTPLALSEVRCVVNALKSAVLSTSHNLWLLSFLWLNWRIFCAAIHLQESL